MTISTTSGKDFETSPKVSIDRHQPDEIDQHSPCIIDHHPQDSIGGHPPEIVDRHQLLNELRRCIVELEPVEEREYKSEASHIAMTKHLKPPIAHKKLMGFTK